MSVYYRDRFVGTVWWTGAPKLTYMGQDPRGNHQREGSLMDLAISLVMLDQLGEQPREVDMSQLVLKEDG